MSLSVGVWWRVGNTMLLKYKNINIHNNFWLPAATMAEPYIYRVRHGKRTFFEINITPLIFSVEFI
jgi:hypothetical protein